jgi:acyl carrier protein
MNQIEQKIVDIIKQELRLDIAPLLEDELAKFEADSLDRAEIIFSIEDEFGITLNIPDKATAVKIFGTVQSVVDYVTEQLNAGK